MNDVAYLAMHGYSLFNTKILCGLSIYLPRLKVREATTIPTTIPSPMLLLPPLSLIDGGLEEERDNGELWRDNVITFATGRLVLEEKLVDFSGVE